MAESDELPSARVAPAPKSRAAWLPLSALFFAIYLAVDVWRSQGPVLTIYAQEGYGLAEGDPLRYRGIDVGAIHDVELDEDLERIELTVRLEPEAAALCRDGTRFWVVRPQVSVDSVSGLDTIVGARYLSVAPGELDAPARYEFTALEEAPAPAAVEEGGLELRLEADARSGLSAGAQLTFRGVPVGTVLATRLASDATGIEIDAYVQSEYAGLVRTNTRFWRTGGLSVNLALTGGLSVEVDSLRQLVVGGIAFATPDEAGAPALDGAEFELLKDEPDDAAEWSPSLALGEVAEAPAESAAQHVPVTLEYEKGLLSSDKRRDGWAIAIPGGLLGPRALLTTPEEAREGSASLVVDGRDVVLDEEPSWQSGGLVLLALELEGATPLFARDVAFGPELQDCLVVVPGGESVPISRARLRATEAGWELDEVLGERSWPNGALVLGSVSERFVGMLVDDEVGLRIIPFAAEIW